MSDRSVEAHAREIDRLSSDLAAARTRMALLEKALNDAWEHHCGGEHHPCEHDHIDGVVDDLLGAMFNDCNG